MNTSGSSLTSTNRKKHTEILVWLGTKNKKLLSACSSLGNHTDCGPMGLGQYHSLGEYCDPHTASSVFLILLIF